MSKRINFGISWNQLLVPLIVNLSHPWGQLVTCCVKLKGQLVTCDELVMWQTSWLAASPWRSCHRTCALSAVIYSWECRNQVTTAATTTWRSRYVYGKTTAVAVQPPCWGRLDSYGCLRRDLSIAIRPVPLPRITWLLRLIQNGTSLVYRITATAIVLGYCVCCLSLPSPEYSPF